MSVSQNIEAVRRFWETNPLWVGESRFPPGSQEFFEEHRRTVIDDTMAGRFDPRLLPAHNKRRSVLDLGCGPGFWTVELALRGCRSITAADLTGRGLRLARRRCELNAVTAAYIQQNAEELAFRDEAFSHVNCLGVIHHSPSPSACVREIARVLEGEGTACISVYYRNLILRSWQWSAPMGRLLSRLGIRLRGRGRETLLQEKNADELVRMYDGKDNPIGRAFSRKQFIDLLQPHFDIKDIFLHFFPARSIPFRIPRWLHRWLDRHLGFMICASLVRHSAEARPR